MFRRWLDEFMNLVTGGEWEDRRHRGFFRDYWDLMRRRDG